MENYHVIPQHIRNKIQDRRAFKRLYQRILEPDDKRELNRLNNRVKAELKEFHDDNWRRRLEELNTEDNSLSKMAKALAKKKILLPPNIRKKRHGVRRWRQSRGFRWFNGGSIPSERTIRQWRGPGTRGRGGLQQPTYWISRPKWRTHQIGASHRNQEGGNPSTKRPQSTGARCHHQQNVEELDE